MAMSLSTESAEQSLEHAEVCASQPGDGFNVVLCDGFVDACVDSLVAVLSVVTSKAEHVGHRSTAGGGLQQDRVLCRDDGPPCRSRQALRCQSGTAPASATLRAAPTGRPACGIRRPAQRLQLRSRCATPGLSPSRRDVAGIQVMTVRRSSFPERRFGLRTFLCKSENVFNAAMPAQATALPLDRRGPASPSVRTNVFNRN